MWGAGYWRRLEECVGNYQPHPEIVAYQTETLRSINSRLYAVVVALGGDIEAGRDFPPLGTQWIADLHQLERRRELAKEKHPQDEGDT